MKHMVRLMALVGVLMGAGVLGGCVDQQSELTIVVSAPTDGDRVMFPGIPEHAFVIKYNAVSNENYTLTVHSANGVLIKTLARNQPQAVGDTVVYPWDLTDSTEQRVVPGVYVINYQTATIHTIFTLFVH